MFSHGSRGFLQNNYEYFEQLLLHQKALIKSGTGVAFSLLVIYRKLKIHYLSRWRLCIFNYKVSNNKLT